MYYQKNNKEFSNNKYNNNNDSNNKLGNIYPISYKHSNVTHIQAYIPI